MLNIIAVMGRLARDPEMRQTTTGKRVCTFRIACDRGRKDANGNSQTDWIPCTAWEKTAEFICKYFGKGALIAVDGRLQSRQYQDKNGQNRTGKPFIAPSKQYKKYEQAAMWYLTPKPKDPLSGRYRVATVFYMPTRRKVDLTNLLEACHDTLVAAKILADDNNTIIASVDGSRVMYDKANPRTEIFIEEMPDDEQPV